MSVGDVDGPYKGSTPLPRFLTWKYLLQEYLTTHYLKQPHLYTMDKLSGLASKLGGGNKGGSSSNQSSGNEDYADKGAFPSIGFNLLAD